MVLDCSVSFRKRKENINTVEKFLEKGRLCLTNDFPLLFSPPFPFLPPIPNLPVLTHSWVNIDAMIDTAMVGMLVPEH